MRRAWLAWCSCDLSRAAIEPARTIASARGRPHSVTRRFWTVASEAEARSMLADTVFRFDAGPQPISAASSVPILPTQSGWRCGCTYCGRTRGRGLGWWRDRLLHRNLKDAALTARFAEWQAVRRAARAASVRRGRSTGGEASIRPGSRSWGCKRTHSEYLWWQRSSQESQGTAPKSESIVRAVADTPEGDGVNLSRSFGRDNFIRPSHPLNAGGQRITSLCCCFRIAASFRTISGGCATRYRNACAASSASDSPAQTPCRGSPGVV